MFKRMRWNIKKIILPIICFLWIFGCESNRQPDLQKYRESRVLMGTMVQIDVCYDDGSAERIQQAYKEIWKRLEEIHWRMSVFDERSDIAKINQSYQNPVTIGADTYQLLENAKISYLQTMGAFDITVWPLIELWKQAQIKKTVPEQSEIDQIMAALGEKNIDLLGNNTVELLHPLTKVDLGGIAKGYAIDEAARIFRKHNFKQFFIDAGGDVYVGGKNCSGNFWRIGIRDPGNLNNLIDVIEMSNKAVTTSGNYEQFYIIDGEKWSHIINPSTGYPQKGVVSATVIAPNAQKADILSTALCVLGPNAGISLMDSLGSDYAALLFSQGTGGHLQRSKSANFISLQNIR